ncbi:MAG: glycerol-3-phosphate dehydrogenase, partial [candidate division Zixibacteria bacterium]|nr:glycerol-3-phosphate dehydrogenase [candidate division Zixibacteria bacterium]
MTEKMAVLGAGSWGIAIANLLYSNGHKITLWEFNRNDYQSLVANRTHQQKLPGIVIPDEISISNNLEES